MAAGGPGDPALTDADPLLEKWFRAADIDCDGSLSRADIEYFVRYASPAIPGQVVQQVRAPASQCEGGDPRVLPSAAKLLGWQELSTRFQVPSHAGNPSLLFLALRDGPASWASLFPLSSWGAESTSKGVQGPKARLLETREFIKEIFDPRGFFSPRGGRFHS